MATSSVPRWPLAGREPRRPSSAASRGEPCSSLPRLPQADEAACCSRCHRPIRDGGISAEGKGYHGECFRCDTCRRPICGAYSCDEANGRLCCESCLEQRAPRCVRCRQKVTAKAVTTEEGTYHRECFTCSSCRRCVDGSYRRSEDGSILCSSCHELRAPSCGACGRKVLEKWLSADGKTYHEQCFRCSLCRKQISGSFCIDDKGKKGDGGCLLCEHCYEVKNPPKCCAACRARIDGASVVVGEQSFHEQCFSCCRCKLPIDGNYYKAPDGYLCSGCQPCCAGCKQPLAGSKIVEVDGKTYHAKCFTCCTCGAIIKGGHYETDRGVYRCSACEASSLQAEEDAKELQNISMQHRLIKRNTEDFKLRWRPELEPCSLRALHVMGVPRAQLPRSKVVCLSFDKKTGHVGCAPFGTRCDPRAAVNVSYLASALQVLRRYGREPCFSLDSKDPHDLAGEFLVKRYYPSWLASSVFGEVLFQADYALKELCFGEHAEALPWLRSVFDEIDESLANGTETAARQWFTLRRTMVVISADGALVPEVEMGVETRRLVRGVNGYEDAPYTAPEDPMVKQAALVSARFNEVAAHLPVVGELHALARAMVAARFLLEHGCQCDTAVLERYEAPQTPEGPNYPLQIPTLSKERDTTKVLQDRSGKGLVLHRRRRAMTGGVDLSVPSAKVPSKTNPARLLAPSQKLTPLPFFVQPAAAAAA